MVLTRVRILLKNIIFSPGAKIGRKYMGRGVGPRGVGVGEHKMALVASDDISKLLTKLRLYVGVRNEI